MFEMAMRVSKLAPRNLSRPAKLLKAERLKCEAVRDDGFTALKKSLKQK